MQQGGRKRRALRVAAGMAGGLLVSLLVWGVVIEPRLILDIEREVASIPDLPPAWDGERVGVIADLQVGMALDNTGTIESAVERLIAERPAAVLLAGDFVYLTGRAQLDSVLTKLQSLLRPLRDADIPVYAVLGNHDYAQKTPHQKPRDVVADEVTRALEEIGVVVLQNEAVRLEHPKRPGSQLWLVGIGPDWPGHAKPEVALRGVPDGAPRIVMFHNPNTFAELPARAAPFAVAGHTHGGQIRIPFLPEWTWLTFVWSDAVHADGWIPNYGAPGNDLYVNRGIGFSKAPVRINAPPELTLFSLVPERGPSTTPRAAR